MRRFGLTTVTTAALARIQAMAAAAAGTATAANAAATNAATTASAAAGTASTAAATLGQLAAAQATADQVHASLQAQIDVLKQVSPVTRIGIGATATTALLLNAQADVVITLSRGMTGTSYNLDLIPSTQLLGTTTLTIKSRTTNSVTITIKANAAIAAGSLAAIAWQ